MAKTPFELKGKTFYSAWGNIMVGAALVRWRIASSQSRLQ
jgi:hypothetical protein